MSLVKFYAETQSGVSALPVDAEARDNPGGIMQECQLWADKNSKPVFYSNEMLNRDTFRHTFYPRVR